MAKYRWELEENRKKKALQAVQNAIKSGASYKGNVVQNTISAATKANTTKTSNKSTSSKTASSTPRASSSGSSARQNTISSSTSKSSNGLPGLQNLPQFGAPTLVTPSASTLQRQSILEGGAARRRTNIDSRTGTNLSRGAQREADERNLQLNMAKWHQATSEAERNRLNQQNNAIRERLGLSYDPSTGVTFSQRTGTNYSLPTQLLYGGTAGQRARLANQFIYSREAAGENKDSISMRPTMQQIADGTAESARGVNAHQVMADLYNRAAETWTEKDTENRDQAVQALSDEMSRILAQYGMRYSSRNTGPDAAYTVSDSEAADKLRRAGADETTIAYVEENIRMREAADRLGQGAEAVAKRLVGSIPALIETARQQSANAEQSRQNPEYAQLEQQEQQLEAQLASMSSQDINGNVPEDYMQVYNQLQQVRDRMQQLAVTTPVDQSAWGQTMLREASEAQANATAGLDAVPRFLAETGISIAGNAPSMAATLIPGVGVAVGSGLMAASAAGQRAAELNAQGVSPGETLGRGIVSGLVEGVTEKLPLESMADILRVGGNGFVRNMLRQMGVEASEETASYVMNFVSDWAANDPKAQFSFEEMAQSALGGAISGGFFGTAGTLVGRSMQGNGSALNIPENVQSRQADESARMAQDATINAQAETLLTQAKPLQQGSAERGMNANPYIGMPADQLNTRLGRLQSAYWTADANTQQAMLEDMARISEAIGDQETVQTAATQENSQALGRRMAELDTQRRQAEGMLPGPLRDQAIAQAEEEIQQLGRDAQATTNQGQSITDLANMETVQADLATQPSVSVTNAMQYGETPQQAMLEAEVRANAEAAQLSEREEITSTLMQAWNAKRVAETQAEQTLNGLTLTQHDIEMAQNAARTGMDSQNWEQADNPEKAYLYGKALRAVREADQPIRQFFAQRAGALESEAQKAADAIATHAKDKRWGAAYQRETMERNIRDIFGKDHQQEAEAIIREYITPVHQAVAEGNRLKNNLRKRVKKLRLNKHESALTQMRLEGEDSAAAEYIKNNNIKLTPEMNQKISRAVQEFRNIYNELYNLINQTLLLNGQEPAAFRKNYAPHFTKDKPDTLLSRVRFALGLGKDSSLNVPTDIAGITDTFRPGKKWFGNLLQREGEITDYDAVAGFDQYVETAADVITLTESIQKLRALEDQVRYTLSNEGVKSKIDAIRANRDLDALQQRQQIEEVYDTNRSNAQQLIDELRNQQRMGMGRFVTELRRYTDNLAGKKSREDRGWEDFANRQIYSVAKKIEGRVAANMISLNPGSWLTNVIPITQATGEVSVPNLLRGMYQTVKGTIKDDGYRDASAFLTNRYGSERLDKTVADRVSDLTGAPMELIDHFTANTIHRARYTQNINNGMSMDKAIADADAYTASLMADRSKGALPTAFNATNPVRKVFTMFQTEVNNQLSYLFKDMPKAQRKKGVSAVAWAYTKVFVTAHLFNIAYSALTGRDSALDPIGMIADALGVGDDEDEEKTTAERLAGLAEDIGGNIPFIGGVLFDGGRVPISSALPNFANLAKAAFPAAFGVEWSGEKRAQAAAKELAKPLTYLLPRFGGGAIKRGIEGFATVDAGGSYTYDNEGNRQLQFPTYGQKPLDYAQAMIFGKWSSDEAQQYIDSGFKGLSADETAVFDELRNNMGVDGRQAMEAVLSLRGFQTVKDAEGNTVQSVKDQQRLALFDNQNLTPEQKTAIDQALIVSGEDETPADYSDYTNFVLSMYDSEDRRAAAEEAVQHGLTVDQFVQWDDRLRSVKSEKDRFDKNRYTDAQANAMVLDEIMQDSALSDSEKQALSDYVLIASMSDTQKEKWDAIRGQVNASDFVRFKSDVSAYEKEYEKTGADNAANVAQILRGYDSLTDEQRDALYQTYSDNMSKNPFHVSVYEKNLTGNSFFGDLTDEGKAELRSLANEYEQAIEEGKELNSWEGKAYMAKEAGIAPETYILYRVALAATNADGEGSAKQSEAQTAVNLIPGLTQEQKAYLYQSTNSSWKKNPFGSATVTKYSADKQEAINPVAGGTLSSSFGPRSSPTAGASSWHKAVDIAAPAGTPVQAVKSGKVTSSGWVDEYGWTVHIDHGDGTETEYHHMQAQSSLKPGDTVEQGEQIGAVGSTGISTGPHLDLQAWQDGHIVDPLTIIPEYGNASGYVYDGTVSAGVVSSGQQESSESSGSSGSSDTGLKKLKGFKSLPTL